MVCKSKQASKRILLSIFVMLLLCIAPLTALAAQNVDASVVQEATLTMDGEKVDLEVSVRIVDGRLFLPVARLAGLFNATAKWDQDNEEVTIFSSNGDQIILGNGVPTVYVNDKRYRMDVVPFNAEGRIYIPVRYIAELMNVSVNWNTEDKVVELTSLQASRTAKAAKEVTASIFNNEAEAFTQEDLKLLAKITQVEAGYESYEGQLAVANVILNRVKDSRFPSTIRDVIYSGKQFPPAHNGLLDKSVPNASVLRAAKDALNGKNNVEDAIYFFNPRVSKGSFWSSLKVIDTIGTHRFAK